MPNRASVSCYNLNKICSRSAANLFSRRRKAAVTIAILLSIYVTTTIIQSGSPLDVEDESDDAKTNISIGDPILQPSLDNAKIFLLIFVPSPIQQQQSSQRRQAIRETWGDNCGKPSQWLNIMNGDSFQSKTVFLLGRHDTANNTAIMRESWRCNDILQGDFRDCYTSVTQKVFMGLRWALMRTNVQFILKADQDVYIHVPRMINWLRKGNFPARLYGGVIKYDERVPRTKGDSHAISRKLYSKNTYPPYVLGAFILISSNIIPDMLKSTKIHIPIAYDDPYLGILAKELNITAFSIRNFHYKNEIRYSSGRLLKTYPDCQFVDVFTIGDSLDRHMQHYVHQRFREVDILNITWETPKCRWSTAVERNLFYQPFLQYLFGL